MIIGWRLIKEKRVQEAFNGEGARIYGGRWNHKGTLAVYISGSLALAALEEFVHLGYESIKIKFAYIRVMIPDSIKTTEINETSLPGDWRKEPPPESTKNIGTEWAKKMETAVFRVPSVIIPVEFNYLLNPLHPDFHKITKGRHIQFSFDPRMWKVLK